MYFDTNVWVSVTAKIRQNVRFVRFRETLSFPCLNANPTDELTKLTNELFIFITLHQAGGNLLVMSQILNPRCQSRDQNSGSSSVALQAVII